MTTLFALLACAPTELADPTFELERVPEWVEVRSLDSARVGVQDAEPLGEQVGFLGNERIHALDWDSAQVQVALSYQGLLWTVWLEREDLTSAVTQERFVEVGEQGAGVRFPRGMVLDAYEVLGGWELSHEGGLEPIFAPGQVVDQVFEQELSLSYRQGAGFGMDMVALPGATFRSEAHGEVFASLQSDEPRWVTPIEEQDGGWWVQWDAPFGQVQGWLPEQQVEHRPMEAGGWGGGGWGCGGSTLYGVGFLSDSVVLPAGTLLVEEPGGRAFGRVEQERPVSFGEPVGEWVPVWLPTPWGERELWVQLGSE